MIMRMLGAARLNVDTYEEVEKDSSATKQALIVVVLVSIAAGVGGLLAGDEVDVLRGLGFGIVRGVVSWAVWALVAMFIGTKLLKTEETEANWGQVARCTGFCPDAWASERAGLPVGVHHGRGLCLAGRGHGDCRPAELGLHLEYPSVDRDPDRPHSCGYRQRDHLLGPEPVGLFAQVLHPCSLPRREGGVLRPRGRTAVTAASVGLLRRRTAVNASTAAGRSRRSDVHE